jgi:hypothetical protein
MPTPTFDIETAVAVSPWRHAPTARTVAFHQPSETPGYTELFSVTRQWIAVATNEHAEENEVPPAEAVAGLPSSAAIFSPIFDGLTGGAGTLASLSASAADVGRILEGVVGGERKSYRVAAGTDAQALPGIVRPVNFNASTNAVLFVSA